MNGEKISFIIPCYGGEESIKEVINEIDQVISMSSYDYEVIAVNDCSPDHEWDMIQQAAQKNHHVTGINLSKNGGKDNAIICGMNYVKGDYIVIIDDDLQCPVDHLFELMEPLINENYDVSIAKYKEKKESKFKCFGSKVNDMMVNLFLQKDKNLVLSNFVVMKAYIKDEILHYKNPYTYLDGLLIRSTRYIKNVLLEERERPYGKGNFTFYKSFQMWINGLTSFSVKPLRFTTILGFIFAFIGAILVLYTVFRKIFIGGVEIGFSSLFSINLIIGGIIMIMLGIIGEYIGRIYICLNNSPQYVVKEVIKKEKSQNEDIS